ncbi:MAG: hypothetical protein II338_01760, partial [Bacteroidaceae bacterium]|nr:hypothetical protein [Bacteroidaceae bacterium]
MELPLSVKSIEMCAFKGSENLSDVYYEGTETDRANIDIDEEGNEYLLNATWHYNWFNKKWCNHTFSNNSDTSCNRCGEECYPGGNTLV